jgi:hypothetical protein
MHELGKVYISDQSNAMMADINNARNGHDISEIRVKTSMSM